MRSKRASRSLSLTLCLVATSGCADFDDAIYKSLDPDKASTKDGGGGSGGDGGGATAGEGGMSMMDGGGSGGTNNNGNNTPNGGDDGGDTSSTDEDAGPPRLVDECSAGDIFELKGSFAQFTASTVGFKDDVATNACFPYKLFGHEGWMAVQMKGAEKWHFHVAPKNNVGMGQAVQNPAVFMRGNCSDDRGCNPGTYLDTCGDGQDEHFTFEAPSSSNWFLAIDDRNNVEGSYLITAVKTQCGNGQLEHNESCDDNNKNSGDGCSQTCRVELGAQNASHVEVNDDWTTANILSLLDEGPGTQTVRGSVGGLCDIDMFAFTVPETGKVSIAVKTGAGDACTAVDAGQSTVALDLIDTDEKSVLGSGTVKVGETCPVILDTESFAHNLPAGTYYVRLTGEESKNAFSYQLSVTTSM